MPLCTYIAAICAAVSERDNLTRSLLLQLPKPGMLKLKPTHRAPLSLPNIDLKHRAAACAGKTERDATNTVKAADLAPQPAAACKTNPSPAAISTGHTDATHAQSMPVPQLGAMDVGSEEAAEMTAKQKGQPANAQASEGVDNAKDATLLSYVLPAQHLIPGELPTHVVLHLSSLWAAVCQILGCLVIMHVFSLTMVCFIACEC